MECEKPGSPHAFAACARVRRRRVPRQQPGLPAAPGTPNPPSPGPQIPPGRRSRATRPAAPRASPRWGGEGAGVRVRFPRLQGHGEQFPTLPRICKKKKKSLHVFLVGGFVSAILKVGDTKHFYLRMPLHTRSCKVFLLQGALGRKKIRPAFCRAKDRIMKPKTFYFINHLIFAWETLLIEWVLPCQSFIIIYGL